MAESTIVVWSPQAQQDLSDSLDFIAAQWSQAIGARFLQAVQQKVQLIRSFPLLGTAVDFPKQCRKVYIKPYHLLLYRVTNQRIEIVRLIDGRRSPQILIK